MAKTTVSKYVVVGLLAALAGAALTGGGVYLWRQREVDRDRARARRAESDAARLESRVAELEKRTGSSSEESDTQPPAGEKDGADRSEPRPLPVERRIGYIKKISETGGRYRLVVDYVEMLTGDEAVEAARADGSPVLDDDGTIPNDYYIRNRNTLLREFDVARDAHVQVCEGSSLTTVVLGVFHGMMPGGTSPDPQKASAPYWLTIRGGVVVRVEEQYLP